MEDKIITNKQMDNTNEIEIELEKLEKEFEKLSSSKDNQKAKEENTNETNETQRVYRQRPMILNNATKKFDIKFASASLTFTHVKLGQLHCEEYRWGLRYEDGKNVFHLIGGKVEPEDKDILYTGIREFVEETNIFMDNKLVLNGNISELSNHIYNQLYNKVKYYDILVNPRNNLYHRCFVFNINKLSDIELRGKIMGLPRFYKKLFDSNTRINKELNSLKWINYLDKEKIQNEDNSSLLKDFYLCVKN